MRNRRFILPYILVICLLALSACGSDASFSTVLSRNGIDAKSITGMKVELRFLAESKGTNYKYTDISSNAELLKTLIESLNACKPAQKPQDTQFTPELRSDCELVITDGSGNSVSLYYESQGNLLIYPDRKAGKKGDTLLYQYFTPDDKLGGMISSQQQLARLKQENAVKPFRNMEELTSSIDPDELAEEGTELDFEFFNGVTPMNAGTACRVYTSVEFPAVPQDSYLITAYGKNKSGQQEKLSIDGMEANTNYTKILVSEPDDALESVDTGEEAPDAYAAVVKKDAVDPRKWIVFVDDSGNILDVILPEDIVVNPNATVIPEATPEPSPTPTPEATASPEATPTVSSSATPEISTAPQVTSTNTDN